jgi:hypothetical protein
MDFTMMAQQSQRLQMVGMASSCREQHVQQGRSLQTLRSRLLCKKAVAVLMRPED